MSKLETISASRVLFKPIIQTSDEGLVLKQPPPQPRIDPETLAKFQFGDFLQPWLYTDLEKLDPAMKLYDLYFRQMSSGSKITKYFNISDSSEDMLKIANSEDFIFELNCTILFDLFYRELIKQTRLKILEIIRSGEGSDQFQRLMNFEVVKSDIFLDIDVSLIICTVTGEVENIPVKFKQFRFTQREFQAFVLTNVYYCSWRLACSKLDITIDGLKGIMQSVYVKVFDIYDSGLLEMDYFETGKYRMIDSFDLNQQSIDMISKFVLKNQNPKLVNRKRIIWVLNLLLNGLSIRQILIYSQKNQELKILNSDQVKVCIKHIRHAIETRVIDLT